MKTIPTISYTRFSSGPQQFTSSANRQQEAPAVQDFIKKYHLQIVEVISDNGVSSKDGKNFDPDKALGSFINKVKEGEIQRGSCLLIENWDRWGRDNPHDQTRRFLNLIEEDIKIGVVGMDILLDDAYLTANDDVLATVVNDITRSHKENDRKSVLIRHARLDALARAKAGSKVYFGGNAPSWIKGAVNKDGQRTSSRIEDKFGVAWIIDEKKVNVIKRLFSEYKAGQSARAVGMMLAREHIPTFHKTNGKTGEWSAWSIRQALASRAVLGELQFGNEVIPDYYPRLVSAEDFAEVQAMLRTAKVSHGGSTTRVPNIFRGLLVCGHCGSPMDVFIQPLNKANQYIYCRRNQSNNICTNNRGVRAQIVETAVLGMLTKPEVIAVKTPETQEAALIREQIARQDTICSRMVELLAEPTFTNLSQAKEKLVQATNDKTKLQHKLTQLEYENSKIAKAPQAIQNLLTFIQPGKTADEIAADQNAWLNVLKADLTDVNKRRAIRAKLPTVYKEIRLTPTVNGKVITTPVEITYADGRKASLTIVRHNHTKYTVET